MEGILKFDLNEPEDIQNHKRCIKATDLACALWDIKNMKKDLEYLEDMSLLTAEGVMDKIYEALENHHIIMDELM